LHFPVGVVYKDETFEQIIKLHDALIEAGKGIEKIKLFNYVERQTLQFP